MEDSDAAKFRYLAYLFRVHSVPREKKTYWHSHEYEKGNAAKFQGLLTEAKETRSVFL